ncbi:hypothetical protein NDA01_05945 [Trichocoleus desertorum AS-A10]|uniref:hypothetical protein n=1 Tax=Trichocoleus desertorum TaxID=1481672 RepID=UPI003299EBBB
MFADSKPTALLDKNKFPEQDSPLDIAGAFDPFLSFGAIDGDAESWTELLAYSWGVDWNASDSSVNDESVGV